MSAKCFGNTELSICTLNFKRLGKCVSTCESNVTCRESEVGLMISFDLVVEEHRIR